MSKTLGSVLLCSLLTAAQPERFSFAGLSLTVTMKDLLLKYPTSTVSDQRISVSAEDSHDDIGAIAVSDMGPGPTVTIYFERLQRNGDPVYPPCAKLLSGLERRYGRPGSTMDAQEEEARNRRFVWNTSTESLTLSCFRMPRQPLYAERITITTRH